LRLQVTAKQMIGGLDPTHKGGKSSGKAHEKKLRIYRSPDIGIHKGGDCIVQPPNQPTGGGAGPPTEAGVVSGYTEHLLEKRGGNGSGIIAFNVCQARGHTLPPKKNSIDLLVAVCVIGAMNMQTVNCIKMGASTNISWFCK